MLPSFEAGREFAVASVSGDVLDLEADLEVLPAAAGVVANLIDFVVPVRNRFAILDPLEGDIRSGVVGSTAEDGDVEVVPLTRGGSTSAVQEVGVGARPPRHGRHGQFTASENGEESFLPVPGQMDDESDVDEPTRLVVGESDTESLNGGACVR